MAIAMANSVAAIKSCVFKVQLSLLEGISEEDKLHAAGKVLTHSEYADVVTERSIIDLCGYPLCKNPIPSTFPHRGRYHISLREHKVYDLQETRHFCSSECLVSSKSFAASLALERDHTTKTLELADAFHNLGLQDYDAHQASSLAVERAPPLIQELNQQDTPVPVQELDLPVSVETTATQQPHQLDSETSLLIHELNEIKITDFSIAGPPDAIEGYIPQKEFRTSHHKQVSDQDKDKMTNLSSGHVLRDGVGNSVKKKVKSKKKAASFNKLKESVRRGSPDMEPEFISCILVDQGAPATLDDANWKIELASSHSESIKGPMSHIAMDEEVIMQNSGRQRSKRQNRVSWADHKNMNLVEDLNPSGVATSSGILKDTCNLSLHIEEGDHAVMPDVSTSRKAASALLQSQEGIRTIEKDQIIQDMDWTDLESAKALVSALTEAAEAVAYGEVDSSEAVSRAGISILPRHEEPLSHPADYHIKERKDLDKELEDDVENIDPRDCWYSAPPKDFKPELSTFGTLWMALDGWISAASIAHVYGRDSNEENNFAFINGKEYLRHMIIPNGASAEIERTLAGCISRTLPGLVETLRFPIPVSTLEVSLGRFLRTMNFMTAIPPFGSKQWQVVVLLLIDALSVHRLPALRSRFMNGRQLLHKVLASANITEAEYEIFRDLVLPMGMIPDFAARCGG